MSLTLYQAASLQKRLIILPEDKVLIYSPAQIAVATFLGSIIAGTLLITANYWALNKKIHAILSLVLGLLLTYIVFSLPYYIDMESWDNYPTIAFVVLAWLLVHFLQIPHKTIIESPYYQLQPHYKPLLLGLMVGFANLIAYALIELSFN